MGSCPDASTGDVGTSGDGPGVGRWHRLCGGGQSHAIALHRTSGLVESV
jgi:hypothetical protein